MAFFCSLNAIVHLPVCSVVCVSFGRIIARKTKIYDWMESWLCNATISHFILGYTNDDIEKIPKLKTAQNVRQLLSINFTWSNILRENMMLNEPFGFRDNVEFQQEQNSILNDRNRIKQSQRRNFGWNYCQPLIRKMQHPPVKLL